MSEKESMAGQDEDKSSTATPKKKNGPPESDTDFLGEFLAFVKDHPVIIGTLLYCQVTTVGIVYIWALLGEFNINVFDFAEANDFLLAAFKQPFAFIFAVLTLVIFFGEVLWFRERRKRKGIQYSFSVITLAILGAGIIAYTIGPAYFFGIRDAGRITKSKQGLVNLQIKGKAGEVKVILPKGEISIIGTTDKFAFFYAHDSKRCVVLPVANIGSIMMVTKAK